MEGLDRNDIPEVKYDGIKGAQLCYDLSKPFKITHFKLF